MNPTDPQLPYHIEQQDGKYQVLDEDRRVLIVCGDAGSARQYAVLMNEAFQRGYKSGFRKAKGR